MTELEYAATWVPWWSTDNIYECTPDICFRYEE
jgi:hypothetical protein